MNKLFLILGLIVSFANIAQAGLPPVSSTNSSITALPGNKIRCNTSGAAQNGCLSSTNWSTFNAKQAAGSYSAQEFYVSKDIGDDANAGNLLKPFLTIGAGMTACTAVAAYFKQCTIHVAPSNGGTGSGYLENVTFSQQGINLICDANQANTRACLITGIITVNMTGTSGGANYVAASNESYMSGFVVTNSSTNNDLVFSGTTFQRFISTNNYFDQNGSVSSAVISNSGTTGGVPSAVISYDTTYSNSHATNPTVSITSGARFWMYGTTSTVANGNAAGPSVTQSGAASSTIFNLVQLTGQYNLSENTATSAFNLSTIASGSNPCLVTPSSANVGYAILSYFGCNSTNTNSITGSGVLVNSPANIRINSSGDIISTVTQTSFPGLPQGEVMIGNGATTGTNVLLSIKGGHVKVTQTTAPTATVNANAGTSATCTLTNGRDSSGIINLTQGSGSWASGTQCTLTWNLAYGVSPNCVISPHNAAAASHAVTQQMFSTTTTTTLLLASGVADSAATASQWSYKCEEP